MSNKHLYRIIDEPRARAAERLIVNPLVILFVSIFLPLLWSPPLMGRFWMPFVWIMVNSFLLGSPTFWKELLISVGALGSMLGLVFMAGAFAETLQLDNGGSVYPYFRIALLAAFYLFLYLVVFIQMAPWSIYDYVRGGNR